LESNQQPLPSTYLVRLSDSVLPLNYVLHMSLRDRLGPAAHATTLSRF
jgi:hypothetical protein